MKRLVPIVLVLASCTGPAASPETSSTAAAVTAAEASTTTITSGPTTVIPTTTSTTATVSTSTPDTRPDWLGTRPLPLRPDGFGENLPTPPELADRRFSTVDLLPPPVGGGFQSTSGPIPPEVLARSTWKEGCPVAVDELSYLTMSFWGFDDLPHTGEMIVNASAAKDVISVFERLFDARYPIEEMRVVDLHELDLAPTGDGNNTTGFVCRPAVGSTNWSRHASGLAIDLNPFLNPYQKGDLVLPELASAYLDRAWIRPGMIYPGDVVTGSFAGIGWKWGGEWTTLIDLHHFSDNGR